MHLLRLKKHKELEPDVKVVNAQEVLAALRQA
jgi:hypothetical protein